MSELDFTAALAEMRRPQAVEPVGAHTDDERAEPACEERCTECADRDQGRPKLSDADFAIAQVEIRHTTPPTIAITLGCAGVREAFVMVWLHRDPECPYLNHVAGAGVSAYVADSSALVEWARSSQMIADAVRRKVR